MNSKQLRTKALSTIEAMLEDGFIRSQDLLRFARTDEVDLFDPEYVRADMENWYRSLGIEVLTGEPFSLQLPYFTREEIETAHRQDEMLVCVPKGISACVLGRLFHLTTWALDDPLVSKSPEIEDFWFKTKKDDRPEYLDKEGREIRAIYQREGKLGMSLERYLCFAGRKRYLAGAYTDQKYKVWLTNTKYEGKAMLIAGIDSRGKLSVHGWMPQFHSPFAGSRYVKIPDHI